MIPTIIYSKPTNNYNIYFSAVVGVCADGLEEEQSPTTGSVCKFVGEADALIPDSTPTKDKKVLAPSDMPVPTAELIKRFFG